MPFRTSRRQRFVEELSSTLYETESFKYFPDAARFEGRKDRGTVEEDRGDRQGAVPRGPDPGAAEVAAAARHGDPEPAVAAGQVPERAGGVQPGQPQGTQQQRGAAAEETARRHLRRTPERGVHLGAEPADVPHHIQERKVSRFVFKIFFNATPIIIF